MFSSSLEFSNSSLSPLLLLFVCFCFMFFWPFSLFVTVLRLLVVEMSLKPFHCEAACILPNLCSCVMKPEKAHQGALRIHNAIS